jgi:nicotinamidase-related amidase
MLLHAAKSSLLLIDVQERLLPAMAMPDQVVAKSAILLEAARALAVPILASEQYPKGLGRTVEALRGPLGNGPVFEKLAFSCWRDEAMKAHLIGLHEAGRPQVVMAGIEAHVCVLQTAVDLVQAGFGVFVVADAVSSRAPQSVALAVDRMRACGIAVVNAEMALFELLGRAGTPEFKAVSRLVR